MERCRVREIIEMCIALDTAAIDTYATLAEACQDPGIRVLFRQMGLEEEAHVGWWADLLEVWEAGLLPPVSDEDSVRSHLTELANDVRLAVPEDCSGLTPDEMLAVAAHLEFFMLDPAFAELISLARPIRQVDAAEAYSRHIMRLVTAIEGRHDRTDLSHFLARALARTLRDQERLQTLATKDALTDLYNRRGFYGYVSQWTSWSVRYGHPVALAIVDIDHFKSINDTYGHPTGDIALRSVAIALRRAVRTSDLVGRYGGDEFAILAPETSAEELVQLMERVLAAIHETQFDLPNARAHLTVSVGGAFAGGGDPVTPEQLLAAADQSLYEAKDAGRNRAGVPKNAAEL